jgi:hypothetical protein
LCVLPLGADGWRDEEEEDRGRGRGRNERERGERRNERTEERRKEGEDGVPSQRDPTWWRDEEKEEKGEGRGGRGGRRGWAGWTRRICSQYESMRRKEDEEERGGTQVCGSCLEVLGGRRSMEERENEEEGQWEKGEKLIGGSFKCREFFFL